MKWILEEIHFSLNSIFEELLVVIDRWLQNGISGSFGEKEVIHWNLIGSPICEADPDEYPVKCGEI